MAQDYDVALKVLFQRCIGRALPSVMGGEVVRWIDKELPQVRNTRADMLGETADGRIIHIEFQSTNSPGMGARMAAYYAAIYEQLGEFPVQVVVYVGREKLRIPRQWNSDAMRFRYEVVDLKTLDGELFLASGSVDDQILAVLMRLRDRGVAIRTILGSIAGLDEGERAKRLSLFLLISGLQGLEGEIEREINRCLYWTVCSSIKFWAASSSGAGSRARNAASNEVLKRA